MLAATLALKELVAQAIGGRGEVLTTPTGRTPRGTAQVWVWRVEDAPARHAVLRPTDASAPAAAVVHCLVFAHDLAALETVRTAVLARPVQPLGAEFLRIEPAALPADLLLSLFIAARIAPRACWACVLRTAPV